MFFSFFRAYYIMTYKRASSARHADCLGILPISFTGNPILPPASILLQCWR